MTRQLRGWKQIAFFFAASVRTVQRWEARHGLPVERKRGTVYANADRLAEWDAPVTRDESV